jgi:hypothetical protein
MRNTRCNRTGGKSTRLSMPNNSCSSAPGLQTDFRELSRLSRAGVTGNDYDLM